MKNWNCPHVIPSFKRRVIDKKTLSDAAQNIELSPKKLPVRFVNTSQRGSSPIFLPYHMGTVSVMKTDIKKCDSTALTTYFYIVRAVLSQTYPLFLPYLMGAVSVKKTDAEKQNHLSSWLSTHSHLLNTFFQNIGAFFWNFPFILLYYKGITKKKE